MRLVSWDALGLLISATRTAHIQTPHASAPLWCIRSRSKEERLRTGPVSRGVRLLNKLREVHQKPWTVEGHYLSGQESVWISFTRSRSETCIIFKDPSTGTWTIEPAVYTDLGLPGDAAEWLSSLL